MSTIAEQKKENFAYTMFVICSAIIGFIVLYGVVSSIITISATKGVIDLTANKIFISIVASLVGVAIFILISLLFKDFFKKIFLSEIFLYLYMGFLTTAINIIFFKIFLNIFSKNAGVEGLGWKIAEALAFIVALIFAFVTNKLFVFKSYGFNIGLLAGEFFKFAVGRLFTEFLNFLIMWIMIDIKHFDSTLTKVIASIVVIVLNYIFSKFIIFKKEDV